MGRTSFTLFEAKYHTLTRHIKSPTAGKLKLDQQWHGLRVDKVEIRTQSSIRPRHGQAYGLNTAGQLGAQAWSRKVLLSIP